ncbi:hypothetical protein [Adlercreutzia murintestinalis]|jgi:hypothetical protein|uniref:hypothetical protein n=1 Tax=Adlercreutzia murintestinalis TaxID=2941325 RepID=UPI00203A6B72|nr:hypothetical protein [Adlercreutzia murintestinalis]
MAESTKAIASLKKAANYTKLAMRAEGPRSFKRGQGALIKVIHKFGNGTLGKDEAKKALEWRGCDVRTVARKAEENGYLTISDAEEGFQMTLTKLGTEVVKKRLAAEDKAADAVLAGLTDAEKEQLVALCDKISATAEEMGIKYATIHKKRGRRCARKSEHAGTEKCCRRKSHGCKHHGHHGHHGAPQYVFVFENGDKPDHSSKCCRRSRR